MGAQLKQSADAKEVKDAEATLDALNNELKLDLAQAAIDIAGIADPTPISDLIGAGLSVFRGDFVGAGLSLISIIPYAGDALGKTAKGAKLAAKIAALEKRIEGAIASLNLLKKTKAAAAIRARRKAEAAQKAADAKTIKGCDPPSNRFGTRLPSTGAWKKADGSPAEKGDGYWWPDPTNPRDKAVLDATGGKPVQYKDGYPDFSPFAKKSVRIDMKGDYVDDFRNANKAAGYGDTVAPPEGMTWHHHEDGQTMLLVPQDVNRAPHTGGSSIVNDPGY